jgi:AcrR family transcriptional regulator
LRNSRRPRDPDGLKMSRWDFKKVQETFKTFESRMGIDDPREHRRRKIVDAATGLFLRQGYRKTSVDEIAGRAGVAKGTVYLYYKTKADILVHAILEEKKRYIGRLQPILDGAMDPAERLRQWLRVVFLLSNEMPLTARLMSGRTEILAVLEDMPPDLMSLTQSTMTDFVGGLLRDAVGPDGAVRHDIEDRVKVILGHMYFGSLLGEERVRGGLSIEHFADTLAEIIVYGVRGRRAAKERPDTGGER